MLSLCWNKSTLRTPIFLPNEVNLLLAFILSLSGKKNLNSMEAAALARI